MNGSVAVFDLDGTITRRDTFLPYLKGWIARHPRRRRRTRTLIALFRFFAPRHDRGWLKSELIRLSMEGATRTEVGTWTREFVAGLGDAELCPGALAAISRHRAAGDRLVLLSASVDLYVPAIGERFGFAETICTGIVWRGDRLDGSLSTSNRRGEEKVRCIQALRARHPGATFAAYGNSGSDLAHLALVEQPMLVNAGPSARREAEKKRIPVADWRNKPA